MTRRAENCVIVDRHIAIIADRAFELFRMMRNLENYTFSKNVSGWFGSNTSLQVITVTRSSVLERLMML